MILIVMKLNFLYQKRILVKLKQKMCLVMKQAAFSNQYFRSKILKFNGFVAYNR